MEFTKLIATLLFMISILFVGAMNTQAAKLCPVNKSFHVSEYCDETPGNPDCCTCPEGTKWSNVSAAYRQCIPTPEGACFDAVQGKIAWDQKGSKQWEPKNVKSLCSGVKSDFTPRIQCFSDMIKKGVDWTKAIKDCVSKG